MANFEVNATVEQTVIELEDSMNNVIDIETQEKVEVVLESGEGGGGSYTLLTNSEYEEFKLHMIIVTGTILPKKLTPEFGEKEEIL